MLTTCSYSPLTTNLNSIVCSLTNHSVIHVSGQDASTYLQGQLTCDVHKIAIGENTLTAHCDAKGKVWSIFRLIRLAKEQFYLLLRTALLPSALAQLKKYAVFSKVEFNTLDCRLIGIAGEQSSSLVSNLLTTVPNIKQPLVQENNIVSVYIPSAQPRIICILPPTQASTLSIECDTEIWDLLDIQDGVPVLSDVSQEQFIPQAINLQFLERAVSFQKGCYIGQETIARAKYRGANKRALYTLVGKTTQLPQIGSEVEMKLESDWRRTGNILAAVKYGDTLWLQVILNNTLEQNLCFRLNETSQQLLCIYPLPYNYEEV